jgi:protein TIF31
METFKETNGKSKDNSRLSEFHPQTTHPLKCLKKLCFSGWNPPPGNRLQGDFFYLEVHTLEGNTLTITATPKGFVQNTTKQGGPFCPSPTEYHAHSLVDLLRKISPKFKQTFADLIKTNFETHPYKLLPIPFPIKAWLVKSEPHTYDPNRAEEAVMNATEVDYHILGQVRDWNEELQVCKEHPKEGIQDRIMRDRAIFKGHSEFVQAATQGATEILNGNVPPINLVDDTRAHMYIYNNCNTRSTAKIFTKM